MSLARALVSNPTLLLLDEPFSALDALTRIEMHQLVIELWRRHSMAILLVTHDVDEALALADRVVLMDEGRIAHTWDMIDLPRTDRAPSHPEIAGARAEILQALGVQPLSPEPEAQPAQQARSSMSHPTSPPVRTTQAARRRRRPRSSPPCAPDRLRRLRDRQRGRGERRRLGRPLQGHPRSSATRRAAPRRCSQAAGVLDDVPYEIEWKEFTSGPPLLEALNAGAIHVGGVGNTPPLFAAAAKGEFKVVQAATYGGTGDAIVVPKDSRHQVRRGPRRARRSPSPRAARPTTTCSPSSTRPA